MFQGRPIPFFSGNRNAAVCLCVVKRNSVLCTPNDRVIYPQDHDRPNDRNDQAVDVQARCTVSAEHAKQKSSDNCAYDAEDNVEKHTLAALVHNLATYKPGDQT
jgi:hypothetical protein